MKYLKSSVVAFALIVTAILSGTASAFMTSLIGKEVENYDFFRVTDVHDEVHYIHRDQPQAVYTNGYQKYIRMPNYLISISHEDYNTITQKLDTLIIS